MAGDVLGRGVYPEPLYCQPEMTKADRLAYFREYNKRRTKPHSTAEQARAWRKRNPDKAREYCKRWRAKNPEKYQAAQKRAYAKRKAQYYTKVKAQRTASHYYLKARLRPYKMTIGQFHATLAAQDWKCACCGDAITETRSHIDHSHTLGYIRAILCPLCNSGLGLFKDDPRRLRAAASYLETYVTKA